jgi:hypothetical protein
MLRTDTTYTDPKNADFVATGEMLVWRTNGETRYSRLYRPSAETLGWDKPRLNGGEAFAIGSRYGGFSYITLRSTGRGLTRATGSTLYGIRAQIEFNIGPDSEPEDRARSGAWVAKAT